MWLNSWQRNQRNRKSLSAKAAPGRKRAAPARRVQLALERLEARELLTIIIPPHFPDEQVIIRKDSDGNPLPNALAALKSPHVYLIFADDTATAQLQNPHQDPYWSVHYQDTKTISEKATQIVKGGFLNGLNPYGYVDNTVAVVEPPIVKGQPTHRIDPEAPDFVNSPSTDILSIQIRIDNYVDGYTGHPGAIESLSRTGAIELPLLESPILVVVTPPTILPRANGYSGANDFSAYESVVWVGTQFNISNNPNSGLDVDEFTTAFSRQLADAVSGQLTVTIAPETPLAFHSGVVVNKAGDAVGQIADGEAEAYKVRLANGIMVQPYWSEVPVPLDGVLVKGVFIVPDGNAQVTVEKPKWTDDNTEFQYFQEADTPSVVTGFMLPNPEKIPVPYPALPLSKGNVVEFNNRFYQASGNIFISVSDDGQTYRNNIQLVDANTLDPESAEGGVPSLAVWDNHLYIAWTGTISPSNINIAVVAVDDHTGNPTGFIEVDSQGHEMKQTIPGYFSNSAPAIASYDNALFLAHVGTSKTNGTYNRVVLDFITLNDRHWGEHMYKAREFPVGGPPGLTDDKVHDRLLLAEGVNSRGYAYRIFVVDAPHQPKVSVAALSLGVLKIDGFQYVGMNDNITLDQNLDGGLHVTLTDPAYPANVVVGDYAPGSVSRIDISTGLGTNNISVLATLANVPVTINALGNTTVNVGDRGSMVGIQGDITLWGAYHSVDLNLDSRITRSRTQGISLSSDKGVETVTGMSSAATIRFGKSSLATLTLETRINQADADVAGSYVNVWDTPDTLDSTKLDLNGRTNSVSIYGTTGNLYVNGKGGKDAVTVYSTSLGGASEFATNYKGFVDVSNPTGSTALVVNARNDSSDHPKVRLDAGRLTGLAAGDIIWHPVLGPREVTSLAVFGGSGTNTYTVVNTSVLAGGPTRLQTGYGKNTVNIEKTQGPLALSLGGGSDIVNVSPTAQNLSNIQGSVTVTGAGSLHQLWIDDLANTSNSNYAVASSLVHRSFTAFIRYYAMNEVHVIGGVGAETYSVQSTSAGAATYLTTNGEPSDPADPTTRPGSKVNVTGTNTNGGLSIIGASGPTSVTVGGGNLQAINGNIRVDSTGGRVHLDVNDSTDGSAPSAILRLTSFRFHVLPGSESITGLGAATISYYGDRVIPTVELGSGTLTVGATGRQQTTINARGANVNINGTTGGVQVNATGNNLVAVGDGFVDFIRGGVNVGSADRSARLVVNGSSDAGRVATLAAGTSEVLTGLAPAPISYGFGQVTPTIGLGPTSSLTVTGTKGLDLLGRLTVNGSGGNDSFTINDRQGTGYPPVPIDITSLTRSLSYAVTGQDVIRTALFSYHTPDGGGGGASLTDIAYQGITTLELDGSNIGAGFNVTGTSADMVVNGGTGNDTFHVTGFGSGNWTADGGAGAGVNTLDYSAFPTDVTVDLPQGIATGIAGGVRNIQNVTGGQGNNILVGNGGNKLTGGAGRNLLIAGPTASTLLGNSKEDILVGGTTDYDRQPNLQAFDALMAEWLRTPLTDLPYAARVQHLLGGGGLNGSVTLYVSSFHSNGGGNTLTGGAGLDLFYGLLPAHTATPDKTDWRPDLGEIFIDPNGANYGIRIDATALTSSSLTLDYNTSEQTAAPFQAVLLPGSHLLTVPGGTGQVNFTVDPNGNVSYDPSLEGLLGGQGTPGLIVKGARVTIDARALTAAGLNLDYDISEQTAAQFTAVLLPGFHLLTVDGSTGQVNFTVDPNGNVSYDPSLEDVLGGQGTPGLIVKGARVTIDARALTAAGVSLDYSISEQTAAPFQVVLLPGFHLLTVDGSTGQVNFTVDPNGSVSYDPSLEGVLGGQGTPGLIVKGARVSIDARALTAAGLSLDYDISEQTAAQFTAVLLPGFHLLTAPGGTGQVSFTVEPNGNVSYDPSLEGVLGGQGTPGLIVNGSPVTIDARALAAAGLTLDYSTSEQTAAAFPAVLLPGSHLLSAAGGQVSFTVNPDGTVSYPVSEDSLLSGLGTMTLIVVALS